jgi:hypothetical protein
MHTLRQVMRSAFPAIVARYTGMQSATICVLAERRPALRRRWEAALRAGRVSSPLANPDTLVFMMDWTLDRVFEALKSGDVAVRNGGDRPVRCPCGLNPLLAYFEVLEAVLLAELPAGTDGAEPARAELRGAVARVAEREIAAFCAVCQRRPAVAQALAPACSRSR